MCNCLIRVFVAAGLLLTICSKPAEAAPPAPHGDARFWDDYWNGLMFMRQANWNEAIEAFARAAKRNPADGRSLLARGIVQAIVGDFKAARDDLDRARYLKSREPKLWEYAVDAMTNESSGDRGIPIPRSLQKPGQPIATFSGVPGHIIQGGDDYSTAYASAVVYELAMPYRAARAAGKPVESPELNAARRKVGRWFANRMLATPDLSLRDFNEARQLLQRNKLVEARELLDMARSVYSFDADMAIVSGEIWLKVGRPATARIDFTIAATMKTNSSAAYVGRAEAAAMMGDARTARADLMVAARYGDVAKALKERVEALLSTKRVDAEPTALLAEMDKAATDGAGLDKLMPLADRLQRAAAGRRVRYDELYQDNIRRLEDAIRTDKAAVSPRVELAQYLYDEVDSRGEEVEPRRGMRPFRWQFSRAMELGRAMHSVDEALALDPKHVPALVTKAYLCTSMNRGAEAERLVNEGMRLTGMGNADATRLLALYRRRQISRMLTAAGTLRSPTFSSSTSFEHRSDGIYQVTRTTRYEPTPADLARADAIEHEAHALIRQTKQLMESAIAETRGTLDGLLLESSYEDWFGAW